MITLEFDRGTLLVRAAGELPDGVDLPGARFDPRVSLWRAPACRYREIRAALRDRVPLNDEAAQFDEMALESRVEREPFDYQSEAVEAWRRSGGRGVVVLPTGAGKTYVAQLIMERVGQSTLVVTPTLDLMRQWYGVLSSGFDLDVGLVGGGYFEVLPVTVTTYDSAYLHMERLGDRFALLVFDECHHLPGPSFQLAAEGSLAPYRLGLTATPQRQDGREPLLDALIGPIVHRREIKELAGEFLADYETVTIRVPLADAERERYHTARAIYLQFLRSRGIRLGDHGGWVRFLGATSRSEEGRSALSAYREQKSIAQGSDAKVRYLERLLAIHARDRVLIFTSDNATAYAISRRFLMPVITHQTKVKERHEVLERFNSGEYPFVVTSRVLNEGVDIPAASVAVVLSGSGSVREHVQRLGRILRRGEEKRAVLYELVAEDTAEESVSERRRQHDAYR